MAPLSEKNAAFQVSREIFFARFGVILFESIADEISHMDAQAAIDQPDERSGSNQDEPLVAIGRAAVFQFPG
jgi:hypothetical protein